MQLRMHRNLTLASLVAILMALTACNIGRTVDKVTLKRIAPGMLAFPDVGMACTAGGALGPVLVGLGFASDGVKEPKKSIILTMIAAGMCAERAAWDAERERLALSYVAQHGMPALSSRMQDLSLVGQRYHRDAAYRNFQAYQRTVEVFGAPNNFHSCPTKRLRDQDQLLFLLGLTAGLLATIHDIQAEQWVGVSQSIPREVEQASACLDDAKFWGVPGALSAVVQVSIPGAAKPGVDPWAALEAAAVRGETSGIWLGRALQLQAAVSTGKDELVWKVIQDHQLALMRAAGAEPGTAGAANPDYGLLNAYATSMIEYHSDLRYLENKGHRTPLGQLGQKPEPPPEPVSEDLLEGLVEPESATPAAPTPAANQPAQSAPVTHANAPAPTIKTTHNKNSPP